MKRVLPFLLILALFCVQLPHFLAVPAQAAEVDSEYNMVDVLDYSTLNASGSNLINIPKDTSFYIDLPQYGNIYYIDAVLTIEPAIRTSFTVSVNLDGAKYQGTAVNIKDSIYRLTITINGRGTDRISFTIADLWADGRSYINFYSLNVSYTPYVFVDDVPFSATYNQDGKDLFTLTYPDNKTGYAAGTSDVNTNYVLYCFLDSWSSFDRIDILLDIYVNSIESVSVVFNGGTLPLSYDYIASSPGYGDHYIMSFSVDLSDIPKDIDDVPMITISGICNSTSIVTSSITAVSLLSSVGYVSVHDLDPYLYYYQLLVSGLNNVIADMDTHNSSLLTAISGLVTKITDNFSYQNDVLGVLTGRITEAISNQSNLMTIYHSRLMDALESYFGSSGKGEEVKNEAAQMKDNMSSSNAELNSLSKPSGNDISAVDSLGAVSFTGNTTYLTQIVNTKYIKDVFVFVAVLSVISLVLFGVKKGG